MKTNRLAILLLALWIHTVVGGTSHDPVLPVSEAPVIGLAPVVPAMVKQPGVTRANDTQELLPSTTRPNHHSNNKNTPPPCTTSMPLPTSSTKEQAPCTPVKNHQANQTDNISTSPINDTVTGQDTALNGIIPEAGLFQSFIKQAENTNSSTSSTGFPVHVVVIGACVLVVVLVVAVIIKRRRDAHKETLDLQTPFESLEECPWTPRVRVRVVKR